MWRILASVVVWWLFIAELSALSNDEDTRYLLLRKTSIGRASKLIETKTVRSELSCAAHCNINSDCTHFAVDRNDKTVCQLYNTVERSHIKTENDTNSYMRLNPHSTVATEYLPLLDPLVPFLDDTVLWKHSANQGSRNLILYSVRNLQSCYEVCVSFTSDDCWIFSYVETEGKCVIPNLDLKQLTSSTRRSLKTESAVGAVTYAYNRVKVDNTYGDLLSDQSYYNMGASYIHQGTSTDSRNNLILPGIDNEQYCYRVCLVTNSGTCSLFSYSEELDMCIIPHGSGSTLIQTIYLLEDPQYYSFVFDGAYPEQLINQTYITLTDSILHLGTASDDSTVNRYLKIVNTIQECYTTCLLTNDGACLTFSYSVQNFTCVVPHNYGSLKMEDLMQEVELGYDTIVFVEGHTDPLHNESFITLTNVISYQGDGSNDTDYNRNMVGSTSQQDCYTKCLKTNNGYCFEFSYSPSTQMCVVPHDDGTLPIDSFGQEIVYGFNITLFPVYWASRLSKRNYITMSNVTYHKGSDVISGSNYMVFGVVSRQDCYVICLDRNGGYCFSISYAEEFKTCTLPHADAITHLDDTENSVSEGFETIFFTNYLAENNSITDMLYITMDNIIYHKGNFTGPENFLSTGVESEQDCYTLCLTRNGEKCFTFSYHAENKTCLVPEEDGTTVLDDMKVLPTDGFETVFFTNHTVTPLPKPNYLTLKDVIYFRGFDMDDTTLNFISYGVRTLQNCYALCQSRNGGVCFSISYEAENQTCRVPHDAGTTAIQDLSYVSDVGFETLIFNDLINHTLSSRQYITLTDLNFATNTIFSTHGPTSLQDCYVVCLLRNNELCFSFSYTNSSTLCSFPLEDGSLRVDNMQKSVLTGADTILFTLYNNATLPSPNYLNLTEVIAFAGGSKTNTNFNFYTTGLTSAQSCYALCLERNDGYCITYSYASSSTWCRFPKGSKVPTVSTVKTTVESTMEAILVNEYATSNLSAVNTITLNNVKYTSSSDYAINGPLSAQDCYTVCLLRNDDKCFSFSYNSIDTECLFPIKDGSVDLVDITPVVNVGSVTYVLTDYVASNNNVSSELHLTISQMVYFKTDLSDATNYQTPGVMSKQDCYTLCLLRNDGNCFSFSYSHNSTECILPLDGGGTLLRSMKKSSDDEFTTYIFNDYTETSLPTADYITLEGVIFYMGSGKMNSNFNFYTEGVASEQNCYALCLQRNDGICFAFNYNPSTGDCRLPKDEGSTDISNILYTTGSGYNTSVNTAYKSSLLSAVNYVALSNVSYSKDTNYEISGPTSRQDCYIICLMKNGNKCFSFSFTASTTVCSFPLEDGSLTLDGVNKTAAVGTDTIIFTDYVGSNNNISSDKHVIVTGLIYHKSTLENTVNYQTPGVESVQDCYTLCLFRNDGKCFSVSYSASSKECVIPQEAGTTTMKSMKKTGGDFDTYIFSDYADRSLPSPDYITLQDVILFRGSGKKNNNFNFDTFGVTSEENCYALCLHSYGGNCIAFNYSPSRKECHFPKTDGNTDIDDLKYTTGDTFNTTLTTDHIDSLLSAVNYVILTNMSYSEGTNFALAGATSRQDCYIMCLMRNGNKCFSISFTPSTTLCTLPLQDGNQHLDDITKTTEAGTDTLVFTDYTQTDLTLQNHITLTEIIYHMGSSEDDAGNFKTEGVGSEQDCYSLCLYRNGGHCFSFSYSPELKTCIVPHTNGALDLDGISNTTSTDYNTTYFTNYVSANNPLSGALHVILSDIIYYKGDDLDPVNFVTTGVESEQDCYTLCLARNGGNCFCFSYTNSSKECFVPYDDGNNNLKQMTKSNSIGSDTFVFNSHATASLPAPNSLTLEDVIYYRGSGKQNINFNFYTGGVTSEQNCYSLCLLHNSGNCFAFSYSESARYCRGPKDTGTNGIIDMLDISETGYNTTVATTYSSASLASQNYIVVKDMLYSEGTTSNFEITGAGSRQSCYILCLMRNGNKCFSFSYTESSTSCSLPLEDGNLKVEDTSRAAASGTDTILFTDYTVNNNPLTSHYTITISKFALHKGSAVGNSNFNFYTNGILTSQDCYTLCLQRLGGTCKFFSYKSSTKTCTVPLVSGSDTVDDLGQQSLATYSAVIIIANSYATQLNTVDYVTYDGAIYHRGTGSDDTSKNWQLGGVTSSQDCYTACLLYNSGNCNIYSFSSDDSNCIIPDYQSSITINDYGQEASSTYITVIFNSGYTATIPSNYLTLSGVWWSKASSNANIKLSGAGSAQGCYTGCIMANGGHCFSFSYASSTKTCFFPTSNGGTTIADVSQTTNSTFDTYMTVATAYNLDLASETYFSLTDRVLTYSATPSDNLEITGASSIGDCFKLALMVNSGDKIAFSYASTGQTCYIPSYETGDYNIGALVDSTVSTATAVIFKSGFTASIPTSLTVSNAIYHTNSDYTDTATNYKITGVASTQDCYTACLMRNGNACNTFSYYSGTCYIPIGTTFRDLRSTSVTSYTTYVMTSYGMISSGTYVTVSDHVYHSGFAYTNINYNFAVHTDDYTDCAAICHVVNSGRCISFNFGSSMCYIPKDSGSMLATSLTLHSVSGQTAYAVVQNSAGSTIYWPNSYTLMPSQYLYTGSSMDDSGNVKLDSKVTSLEDCYRVCYIEHGTDCVAFTWGSNICSIPTQTSSSTLADIKADSSSSYNSYFLFVTSSRTDTFPSSSYSTLSNLRIRDGVTDSIREMTFSSVGDLDACYRLCLEAMSSCNTFSYDPNTDYCYLTTVNFHSEWTYVEAISGCTGYFAKNSGSWKLITKHRQYQGVMPDNAYYHTGSYHQIVPSGDLAASSSYTTNGNLKNQLIDYWGSLSSKYRIRMELRSTSGTLLKYMEYNVGGTTSTSWFSSGKFVSSSWSDLHSGVTHNAWSMGDSGSTFFINRNGGGCTLDAGWIQITATANSGCTEWASSSSIPMFLYSDNSTYVNWSSHKANFDVLLIYMSFN